MKDGYSHIQLIESSVKSGVTFYHLSLTHQGTQYRIVQRYSKLRTLAMTLPETNVDFPAPQHLEKVMSLLVGDKTFLEQRYNKLQRYFKAVSQVNELKNNQGFQFLLANAEAVTSEEQPECIPEAPVLKGKKLLMRTPDYRQQQLAY